MNNIFVGNLSFKSTKEDVQKFFEPFGAVANVVIMERKKGKSLGYGFVDMPNEDERNKAIAALDGRELMMRILSVGPIVPKVRVEREHKPRQKKKYIHAQGDKPAFKREAAPKKKSTSSAK